MQDEHIDWEAMLKATSQQAKQAARNSERTLGGVAETLRNQTSQAEALSSLIKTQRELRDLLSLISREQQKLEAIARHGCPSAPRLWPIVFLSSSIATGVALLVSGMN